jgi:hypothetical protein
MEKENSAQGGKKTFSKIIKVILLLTVLAVGIVLVLRKKSSPQPIPDIKQDFTLSAREVSFGQMDRPLIGIRLAVPEGITKPVTVKTVEFQLSVVAPPENSGSLDNFIAGSDNFSLVQYGYKDGQKESSVGVLAQAKPDEKGKITFSDLNITVQPGRIIKFWLKGTFSEEINSGKFNVEFLNPDTKANAIKNEINLTGSDTLPGINVTLPTAKSNFKTNDKINVSWTLNNYPSKATVDIHFAKANQINADQAIYSYEEIGKPMQNIPAEKMSQSLAIPKDATAGDYVIFVNCSQNLERNCKGGQSEIFKIQ